MDSQDKNKHIHFSISNFKKTKALSSVLKFGDDQQDDLSSKIKRSVSFAIPKKFVPKIRPQKTKIIPSFFVLNEEKKITKKRENLESLDSKSVKDILSNEDNISLSSITDSNSDNEEENISHKLKDLKEVEHNEIKANINLEKINEEKNKNSKNNSLSSLFNIRKKMAQIKNNSCLKRIKECIDLNLLNLKKKFSLDIAYYDISKEHDLISKLENNNHNKYNSSMIVGSNKNKSKIKSFLIFDVLKRAYHSGNL